MDKITFVLLAAGIMDLVLGDPEYAYHPVRLLGKTIAVYEKAFRWSGLDGLAGGVMLVIMVSVSTLGSYLAAHVFLERLHPLASLALDVFAVYSCLSLKDLIVHARKVSLALASNDLVNARRTVQEIVGRDANRLDMCGVARAAVESIAENFVDGYLSCLFWYVAGGLLACAMDYDPLTCAVIGVLTFKTASTLDSMVGYRSPVYLYFGRAAARFDDAMNFIPARLSVPFMMLAAGLCGLNMRGCLKIALRDRRKHASPNAGHAESCAAGALGIRLGGPTRYPFKLVEKPWLGDGDLDTSFVHIDRTCALVLRSGLISMGAAVLISMAIR